MRRLMTRSLAWAWAHFWYLAFSDLGRYSICPLRKASRISFSSFVYLILHLKNGSQENMPIILGERNCVSAAVYDYDIHFLPRMVFTRVFRHPEGAALKLPTHVLERNPSFFLKL